jgi:hypothetical protein
MEKIINTLINSSVQGVDTYTHNDSTWLIFTESKQWVIELTGHKTLWYNYNFFKNIFAYVSLDAVQNQHLITKWVENNVMKVEDTLQNGVKKTKMAHMKTDWSVEDTLQNGVRHTDWGPEMNNLFVDDALENGIKETCWNPENNKSWIEGVIKNGVKETRLEENITEGEVEGIIEDGVRYTGTLNWNRDKVAKHALEYGVKSSNPRQYVLTQIIDDIVEDGVKITLPLQSREYTGDIDGVLEKGINETKSAIGKYFVEIQDVLENGIKETYDDVYHHKGRIDGVIKSGIKKTEPMDNWVNTERIVSNVVDNGVKETKTPGNGDLTSYIDWLKENKTSGCGYQGMIDDVIENGVKEIKPLPSQTGNKDWSEYSHGREDRTKPFNDYLNDTLEMGVKIN